MEKLPHQEYRDRLASKLKEIRNSDSENPEIAKAEAQGYLDKKKETEEYNQALNKHKGEILNNGTLKNRDTVQERIKSGEIDLNSIFLKDKDFLSNEEWSILYQIISEKETSLKSIFRQKPGLGIRQGATKEGIEAWHKEVNEYETELSNREKEIERLGKIKKFIEQIREE